VKSFYNFLLEVDNHVKGGSIMKPNIGRVDALCRITIGFTTLAWSTAKLVRKPNENMPLFAAICGGMKIAEGITRFCPLTYVAEHKMVSTQEHIHEHCCHHETDKYQEQVVNPT
jgi:hypothetical protein